MLEEIKIILEKYKKEEMQIDELLQTKLDKEPNASNEHCEANKTMRLTLEEAKKRNKTILKEFETIKGNLRSKAIYSPLEMEWGSICENYRAAPSLPVTTWRRHEPVFV